MSTLTCVLFSLLAVGRAEELLPAAVGMYCLPCHNPRLAENGVRLDPVKARRLLLGEQPADDRATFERVLRQLRARAMPPVGNPRPEEKAYRALVEELAAALDRDGSKVTLPAKLVLPSEVARRLGDLRGFFDEWLGLNRLTGMKADAAAFPEFDAALRADMKRETEMFVESQVRENRPMLELWTADYTFVNERLAKLYGIRGVTGAAFRRVPLKGTQRAGLLGQASILTITSVLTRHESVDGPSTSPAGRARWIRTHFLDIPLRDPLPNPSPMLKGVLLSEQLRTIPDPSCDACHSNFLPLGYALENFDPLGRWREEFAGQSIDVSGAMADGTEFDGPEELRAALLDRKDAFYTAITENLLGYAMDGEAGMGQPTPPERMPMVRAILREAAKDGYRWKSVLAGVAGGRR